MSKIIRPEQALSINGVEGRAFNVVAWDGQNGLRTLANQKWKASRIVSGKGYGHKEVQITVEMSFDDDCRNGHNDFSITGSIDALTGRDRGISGGCIHEEIAAHFPELASFIRWHLVGEKGPMHYVANTLYHASDRDHSGRAKGEPNVWDYGVRFGNSPVTHTVNAYFWEWLKARMAFNAGTPKTNPEHGEFRVVALPYDGTSDYKFGPNYTLVGYGEKWSSCPFKNQTQADEFALAMNTLPVEFVKIPTQFSEGKERDLSAARSTAVWPDATDAELCAPKEQLRAALEARLPGMVAELRADIESAGFIWSAE